MGETFIPNYSQSMAGFNPSTFSPSFSPMPFSIGTSNVAGINPSAYMAQQNTASFDHNMFMPNANANMSQINPMDYANSFNQIGTGFQSNGAIIPTTAADTVGPNAITNNTMFGPIRPSDEFLAGNYVASNNAFPESSTLSNIGDKITTGLGNIDAKTWIGLGLQGLSYDNQRQGTKETKKQNAIKNDQWNKQYNLAKDRITSNRALDWSAGTKNASTLTYDQRYANASKDLAAKGV